MYNTKTFITFTLYYKDSCHTLEVDRLKCISFIKEHAYTLLSPFKGKIRLIYKNKDLTPFEDIPIVEYFKNKSNVAIKILETSSRNNTHCENPNSRTVSIKKSSEENCNSFILPKIIPRRRLISHKKTISLSSKPSRAVVCSQCHSEECAYYCRNCNIFLCKYCRITQNEHYTHQTLHIFSENLSKSVGLYLQTLKTDLYLNQQACNRNTKEFANSLNNLSRKENIVKKLNQIDELEQCIQSKLPSVNNNNINDPSVFEIEYEKLIKMLDDMTLETFLLSEKDFLAIFTTLNKKEKEIGNIIKDVDTYIQHLTLSRKIDSMYTVIERSLDAAIFFQKKISSETHRGENGLWSDETIQQMKGEISRTRRMEANASVSRLRGKKSSERVQVESKKISEKERFLL